MEGETTIRAKLKYYIIHLRDNNIWPTSLHPPSPPPPTPLPLFADVEILDPEVGGQLGNDGERSSVRWSVCLLFKSPLSARRERVMFGKGLSVRRHSRLAETIDSTKPQQKVGGLGTRPTKNEPREVICVICSFRCTASSFSVSLPTDSTNV